MTAARKTVVDLKEVGVYHCISRCVRRAFLCGVDRYTGISYEHRRSWIADRLKTLSSIFAMEVFAYAVMSNHLHLVVRNRPDLAKGWSAEEVARRRCTLFPKRDGQGAAEAPDAETISAFVADQERVELCPRRLGDISWLMRCLNEPISRLKASSELPAPTQAQRVLIQKETTVAQRADWLLDLNGPESPFA